MTAIFILVRKNILAELMYRFTQKILEGLQQKLEGLEPLSPIAGAATAYSALEVLHIMCYINLFAYLLAYLLPTPLNRMHLINDTNEP